MSFAQELESFMDKSGMSRNRFAAAVGINKGDLHRILRQNILPGEDKLHNIIETCAAERDEAAGLMRAYWADRLGAQEFGDIRAAQKLLDGFAFRGCLKNIEPFSALSGGVDQIPGAVAAFLSGNIMAEKSYQGRVIIECPFADNRSVYAVLSGIKDLPPESVSLTLDLVNGDTAGNFRAALFACAAMSIGVIPRIRYIHKNDHTFDQRICMPGRALIMGDTGFALITEPEAAGAIYKNALAAYDASEPYGVLSGDVFETKDTFSSVMHQPHEAELCDYPFISNHINENTFNLIGVEHKDRDAIIRYGTAWYSDIRVEQKVTSAAGLERFARKGFCKEIAGYFVKPFPKEERRRLLNCLLGDLKKNELFVIDPALFRAPEDVDIWVAGGCLCVELRKYCVETDRDERYAQVCFRDASVADLAKKAIRYLSKFGFCYNKDSAVKIIQTCLAIVG